MTAKDFFTLVVQMRNAQKLYFRTRDKSDLQAAKKLEKHNMFTMGDIARASINNEELLYKLFGVNAELLIDHAWRL